MKKKVGFLGVFIIIFAVYMVAASTNNNNSIEKTISYLSSSKLEGRLAGTEGAIKAEKYLKKELERINLDKYKSDFLIPYDHIFYNPNNQVHSIKLVSGDKIIDFKYGSDFLDSIVGNIDKQLKLTFDVTNISEDNILVIDDMEKLKGLNLEGRIVFIKKDKFKKNIVSNSNSSIHIIQISDEMYKTLESNKDGNIEIQFKYIEETIKANNIVGKIRGNDNNKAVVLSAHFDHVGMAGKDIYRGAVDNASGTSLLLNLAEKLKDYYKDKAPDIDIVIAFFNGEESNLQGSKELVKILKEDYGALYNINFDCIGIKNGGDLTVGMKSGINSKLMEDLKSFFDKSGYNASIENANLMSDHFAFLENNITAINIAQRNVDKIHTVDDILEDVDFEYLEKLSDNLLEFIVKNINNGYEIFEQDSADDPNTHTKEEIDKMNEMDKLLKPHEYIRTESGVHEKMFLILGDVEYSQGAVDKLNTYYPDLDIIKQFEDFNMTYININERLSVDFEKLEKDIVNFKEYNIEDIKKIQIDYRNNEDEILNIALLIENGDNFEDISQDYSMEEYKIGSNTIDISGESYNVCTKLEEYSLEAVYKKVEVDNKTFHIFLKSTALADIKNIDSKPIIGSLISSLK